MTIRAGTSGFSYKEWKGPFYPEKLPAKQMLAYYAERLPAVEINNTFYRMPKTQVVESWADQVPDGFRFSIKASRRITHFKRLKDAGDETSYLLGAVEPLGEKLGALLFQLPPNLAKDVPRLETFLDLVPDDVPAVFEFRHASWLDDDVRDLLLARGRSWVAADTGDDDEPAPLFDGAAVAYLRLRRPDYDDAALLDWAQTVQASGPDEALVFFKHEDEGAGPGMAVSFLEQVEVAASRRAPKKVAARSRKAAESR